jgi:hypothetical protein
MKRPNSPGCCNQGKAFHRILPEIFTLLCVIVIFFQFVLFVQSSRANEEPAEGSTPAKESTPLRERWGIEVTSLKLTAAGHMVDFRYRVTDPTKALPLFNPKGRPILIDQASGTKLNVPVAPKVGSLRQKTMKPEVGRIYFILFGNTGVVKEGSKVTLVIGDVKIEDLTVEGEAGTRP